MKRFQDPSWTLIVLFLGILVAVPLIQTVKEATQENGEGVAIFNVWPSAENLRAYEEKLEEASWAAKLSRPLLQFAHFKWLKDGGEKVVVGSSGWYFYKPGLNYMLARREIVEATNATNDPVAAIVHFRDQLAVHGIHLLLMPVPNKESIYPDLLTSRAANLQGVLSSRTREILDKLRAQGIEVVDLFSEFTQARQQSDMFSHIPLYLAQDTHWSPRGMILAARAAAARLTKLGWVQTGTMNYHERATQVQRLGDLVTMLKSPMIERATELESVPAVQVVTGGENQPYKDGAEANVLVMGDSFLRIYQQDTPSSAGFIAHLAKELKTPMMSLVNDGGGATLVREDLSSSPILLKNKKVVLWEFVERDFGGGLKGWSKINIPPLPLELLGSTQKSGLQ